MANNIMVEREAYEKNGKTYYSYFIKGIIRGKEIKVQVAPPNKDVDKGGYAVLDVVFGDAMEADLVITPFEMKTADGKVITGNSYKVRSYDEDGRIYECAIKPARSSDKNFLNMLLG